MNFSSRKTIHDFLVALATTFVVAAICYPLSHTIGYQTVGLIFLMTIAVLSLFLGRAALIFTSVLIFGVWNFFFIQPLYTFRVHSFHDLIALFANLMVAITASTLISRIRKSQVVLQKSQESLILLHTFLESLNNAISIKDVVNRAQEGLKENFNAGMVLYLIEKNGHELSPRPFGQISLHSETVFERARLFHHSFEKEKEFNSEQEPLHFYSLKEPRKSIGVIGIDFLDSRPPEEEKLILLLAFISQTASALDREISIDQVKEKEIFTESEKLFQTVLNSVSHELKTPIAIISAAVANLNEQRMHDEPEKIKQIGEELEIASTRMNHLVENILDMSRIESGLLKLNLQVCDTADLTGIVVNDLKADRHRIRIQAEENLPFIKADIHLLRQALINILHNALVYTPSSSGITIRTRKEDEQVISIAIIDEGTGIPQPYLTRLFDKFYRVPGTRSGGTGLGLTIARAIAELHGGTVEALNNDGPGLTVIMKLKINNGEQQEI